MIDWWRDKPAIYALGELPSDMWEVYLRPQDLWVLSALTTYFASYFALLICWGICVRTVEAFVCKLWRHLCADGWGVPHVPTVEVLLDVCSTGIPNRRGTRLLTSSSTYSTACWRAHRRTQLPGWRTQTLVDARIDAQPKATLAQDWHEAFRIYSGTRHWNLSLLMAGIYGRANMGRWKLGNLPLADDSYNGSDYKLCIRYINRSLFLSALPATAPISVLQPEPQKSLFCTRLLVD